MAQAGARLAGWKSPEGRAEYTAAYDAALSLWPVPYESRYIDTRFGTTHVILSGPTIAPPLVLLGAATGVGVIQWFPNAAELSRHHRIIAVDFIGASGKGTQTRAMLSRADYANWLIDLLDAFGIWQPAIVGSSQGGWSTLNLAVHAPDRAGDLVLLAPAASLLPIRRRMVALIRLGPFMPAWTARPSMKASFGNRYEVDDLYIRVLAKSLQHFHYQQGALFPQLFTDGELERVKARTLVLVGDKEIIYDPRGALQRATELLPDVETELIADAGHLLNMEQADVVNARILRFLHG